MTLESTFVDFQRGLRLKKMALAVTQHVPMPEASLKMQPEAVNPAPQKSHWMRNLAIGGLGAAALGGGAYMADKAFNGGNLFNAAQDAVYNKAPFLASQNYRKMMLGGALRQGGQAANNNSFESDSTVHPGAIEDTMNSLRQRMGWSRPIAEGAGIPIAHALSTKFPWLGFTKHLTKPLSVLGGFETGYDSATSPLVTESWANTLGTSPEKIRTGMGMGVGGAVGGLAYKNPLTLIPAALTGIGINKAENFVRGMNQDQTTFNDMGNLYTKFNDQAQHGGFLDRFDARQNIKALNDVGGDLWQKKAPMLTRAYNWLSNNENMSDPTEAYPTAYRQYQIAQKLLGK